MELAAAFGFAVPKTDVRKVSSGPKSLLGSPDVWSLADGNALMHNKSAVDVDCLTGKPIT